MARARRWRDNERLQPHWWRISCPWPFIMMRTMKTTIARTTTKATPRRAVTILLMAWGFCHCCLLMTAKVSLHLWGLSTMSLMASAASGCLGGVSEGRNHCVRYNGTIGISDDGDGGNPTQRPPELEELELDALTRFIKIMLHPPKTLVVDKYDNSSNCFNLLYVSIYASLSNYAGVNTPTVSRPPVCLLTSMMRQAS